jgi:phage terminase small subunit
MPAAKTTDPTPYSKIKRHGGERGVATARAKGKSTSSAASASLIDPNKPLTDKQKEFVKFWAEGESITSACVKSGYSDHKLAYRLARMPNVLALKATYEAKYQEAGQMTRQKVMDGMLESIEMAKLMSEPASMISGWREIGKICGYYAPVEHRVKVDVTGNIILDRMNSMSDAELLEVISKNDVPLLEDITDVTDNNEPE